jgi:excisionase family DNA binding protein
MLTLNFIVMEVITFSSKAFQALIAKIDEIGHKLDEQNGGPALKDTWLDIQEVCFLLKISKRTLQTYRDKGVLPFSQVNGKIYFKASDIQKHLEYNYRKVNR